MVDHWNSENQKVLDKLAKKKARNLGKRKKVQFPPEVNEKLKKLKEMEKEIERNAENGIDGVQITIYKVNCIDCEYSMA